MKGIMILAFDDDFNASIEFQYPKDLAQIIDINISNLDNIINIHEKEKDKPNFFQMEINDLIILSFFTGYSLNHFIGEPNYALLIFLEETDMNKTQNPSNFEGMIRRIAYALLPQINSHKFEESFENFYVLLQDDELEPYWEEYVDGELISVESRAKEIMTTQEEKPEPSIETLETEDVKLPEETEINEYQERQENQESQIQTNSVNIPLEIKESLIEFTENENEVRENSEVSNISSDDHVSRIEKEVLEEEITDLKLHLTEKTEKIRELTRRLTENQAQIHGLEERIHTYNNLKESLEDKNNNLEENIKSLTEKSNQDNRELENKNQEIENFKKQLEEKENLADTLKSQMQKIKKENESYIDSITSLKIMLREYKNKENQVKDNVSEEIIDLKKEIKVLRRERDHYKKIVKDNNLL